MTQTQPSRAASWLPVMIRLTAVGYLLFFVPDLILASTHHIGALPPPFDRLFKWGEGGDPVAVMFSTVYVIWALFLFRSARAPLANRLFLDFNLTANSAHFGAMLLMGATMRDEHQAPIGSSRARVDHHGPVGGVLASDSAPRQNLRSLAAHSQAWWSGIAQLLRQ